MRLKGVFKHKSSIIKILIFFLLILASVFFHTVIGSLLVFIFTDNGTTLIQQQDLTSKDSVNYLKLMQLFSSIGLFITPTLLYSFLT